MYDPKFIEELALTIPQGEITPAERFAAYEVILEIYELLTGDAHEDPALRAIRNAISWESFPHYYHEDFVKAGQVIIRLAALGRIDDIREVATQQPKLFRF